VIPREPNRKVAEKPESDDSILLRVFYVIVANLNRMITISTDRGYRDAPNVPKSE
jgi:hypothetical protein